MEKQAITVLISYASLHEPFIYSAPRKIFPSSTLLLNIFSMQPEMIYFLTVCYCNFCVSGFMGTALTCMFSCTSSVQVSEIFIVKIPCELPV